MLHIITSGTTHSSIKVIVTVRRRNSLGIDGASWFQIKVNVWSSNLTVENAMTQLTVSTHILYEFATFVIYFICSWWNFLTEKYK
jgi:hypothetical protein